MSDDNSRIIIRGNGSRCGHTGLTRRWYARIADSFDEYHFVATVPRRDEIVDNLAGRATLMSRGHVYRRSSTGELQSMSTVELRRVVRRHLLYLYDRLARENTDSHTIEIDSSRETNSHNNTSTLSSTSTQEETVTIQTRVRSRLPHSYRSIQRGKYIH